MEIWKDIPEYEGIYQASNQGKIRSHPQKTTVSKLHGVRHWKTRTMKPKACKDFRKIGYRVSLWKNGNSKDFLVARLVAVTFLGLSLDTKMTVNHIDGDRLNNNIENLEWLTRGDNIRHGFATGLYHNQKNVVVENMETGEINTFSSMSKASEFLGRNRQYINCATVRNQKIVTNSCGAKYKCEVM